MVARTILTTLLILLAAITVAGCTQRDVVIEIGGERFVMELALDEESRTQGMMGRESFPEGVGMLFVFPEPRVLGFWMKNCLIDIDVIFLDARGTVTAVHRMTVEPPQRPDESDFAYERRLPTYSSRVPAQFAIELPAGSIDRLNVQVDQRIDLPIERLKAMAK
jgi:uncharacterized protein